MGLTEILGFIAGIGIFLFAMQQLENALQTISGKGLSNMLHSATDSSLGSILSGTVATAILQSSSMVGLMVLAMVGSGLLPLANGVGMVIGANLGTTITGWLVTLLGFKLDLSAFAIPAMGLGAIYSFIYSDNPKQKGLGLMAFALGLLIFGLDVMKDSVATIAEAFEPEKYANLHSFLFLLMGVLFAAIIQSSSATMMITLSALHADLITLQAAAAIVIGADLGTTSTMLLGGLRGSSNKKRVAMSHVLFNLVTAVVAYLLILPFLPDLLALADLTDPLISLVAFHSFFNFLGVVLILPFIGTFARYLSGWFQEDSRPLCEYIHEVPAENNRVAWAAVSSEITRLWDYVLILNAKVLGIKDLPSDGREEFPSELKGYAQQYSYAKDLGGAISEFLLDIEYTIKHKEAHDEIALVRCQKLLKTIRKLNYALKSAKDIRDDLAQQEISVARTIIKILTQRTESDVGNIKVLDKIVHADTSDPWEEPCDDMIINIIQHHDSFVASLYELTQQDELDSQQLATLINVSKHIQEGVRLLAEAVRYNQQSKVNPLFKS